MALRRRWWQKAVTHLAVSSATAEDLAYLLRKPDLQLSWCHLAPAEVFHQTHDSPSEVSLWRRLQQEAGLPEAFVLLPATSAIGSYKNPEFVAQALADPDLLWLPLVLCGIAAEQRAQELEVRFPHLRGRITAAGFSDSELATVYCQALAVVIPSRIEGFGLPAIEVMASGGLSLVADARGLREAGAEAALRFSLRKPEQLSDLLKVVANTSSRKWLQRKLQPRVRSRLARLNPDLIGLSLLAQARRALLV
ncbi:glycosyltransferase [Synechococcus sp. MU1642]|uniref:glycosyltransferase n=1 Tax=Synechococcus sp. MU1642 TaxID=2508348 RepID=UPI001CF8BAAB|nr:glycosyltransferase [Synechococcus sp. MU1642]